MQISCCLSQFQSRWVANANAVFSGIWALHGLWAKCFVISSDEIAENIEHIGQIEENIGQAQKLRAI